MDGTPDMDKEFDGEETLTVYVLTGDTAADDDEGGETDVLTYAPGDEFVVQRDTTAWVDPHVEVLNDSPEKTFMDDEAAGLLTRGRYRWTGTTLLYLGRQKGPIRPPG